MSYHNEVITGHYAKPLPSVISLSSQLEWQNLYFHIAAGEKQNNQEFKPDTAANEKVVPGKLKNNLIVMVVGFT